MPTICGRYKSGFCCLKDYLYIMRIIIEGNGSLSKQQLQKMSPEEVKAYFSSIESEEEPRVGPPLKGSPDFKNSGKTAPSNEDDRIRQAVQYVLQDPSVMDMIKKHLDGVAGASPLEPTKPGRKKPASE